MLAASAVAGGVAAGVVAVFLVAGLVIYNRLSLVQPGEGARAGNIPTGFTVKYDGWEEFDTKPYLLPRYKTVRLPSREAGIELAAWYAGKDGNAPAVVLVHGLGASKACHWVLTPAGMLWRAGFSVLMLDVRDHGDSQVEDGRTAMGSEEYLDVLGAWDWLVAEKSVGPERIGLYGTSLGAATVLIAVGQEPRAAAAFVDSPFADARAIIDEELERNGYPTFLSMASIFMARVVAGDDLVAHPPEEELRKLGGRPLYLTHGLSDTRVGVHHSRRLASIAGEEDLNVTTWFVPEADHLEAMLRRPREYEERLVGFFRAALGTEGLPHPPDCGPRAPARTRPRKNRRSSLDTPVLRE